MLTAIVIAALLGVAVTPPDTELLAIAQAPANAPPEKADKKKTKQPKDPASKAAKKAKKQRRASKPSPDEADEADVSEDAVDRPEEPAREGASFSWTQHPSFRVGKVFRLDVEGKMQEDFHSTYGPVNGLDTWELHRNRFGVKGYVTKQIGYEVEYEFTEHELTEKDIASGVTPKSRWKDVNVNLAYVKNAQVQIGKFKVPFGLDELTGVTHNDYVYRSLGANYLDPGRDVGAMVHGRFLKHGLDYWAGGFLHDGDNATSKKIAGGGHTFAARVSGTPFRPLSSSSVGTIEIGSAFAISALSDDSFRPNGLRGRTIMTQETFYESVYVKGHRRRWEADVDWTAGPASARAEYTWLSDDRQGQGIGDENLPDARGRAWYVSGTWVLTGEDKKRPLKAVEPFAQGGIGAVELAIRFERLWFDSTPAGLDEPLRNPRADTILPSGDRALTLGVNWTLNRFTKLQFNAIREHVEDSQRNPVPNGAAFWSRVFRLQFVL